MFEIMDRNFYVKELYINIRLVEIDMVKNWQNFENFQNIHEFKIPKKFKIPFSDMRIFIADFDFFRYRDHPENLKFFIFGDFYPENWEFFRFLSRQIR